MVGPSDASALNCGMFIFKFSSSKSKSPDDQNALLIRVQSRISDFLDIPVTTCESALCIPA
jgi:hypothetical protein